MILDLKVWASVWILSLNLLIVNQFLAEFGHQSLIIRFIDRSSLLLDFQNSFSNFISVRFLLQVIFDSTFVVLLKILSLNQARAKLLLLNRYMVGIHPQNLFSLNLLVLSLFLLGLQLSRFLLFDPSIIKDH